MNSVLPRPFLQGAAPCPFLVTPCLFLKAEMMPCLFCPKKNLIFLFIFGEKGMASFHHHVDDDDDEMTPSLGQDSCHLETLHTLNILFLGLHVHTVVVKVIPAAIVHRTVTKLFVRDIYLM